MEKNDQCDKQTLESKKSVSIIMPAYNCEKYIFDSIQSIVNQSYTNWELLIVDDGSTDNTRMIADQCSQSDKRIKVFHRKNAGVSAARNYALQMATGDYLTFIDGDDIYHRDRLKRMVTVLENDPQCDIVFCHHREFCDNFNEAMVSSSNTVKREYQVITSNILYNIISDSNRHFVWNSMMKAEIAKQNSFPPLRFAEDFCYIRDCAYACKKFIVLNDVLYFYRRDNENAMTSHFFEEKYVNDYMMVVENIFEFCNKHQLNNMFFQKMLAHEYAQNSMRIRKSTSFIRFVKCMNDKKFREGIALANATECNPFEKILFYLIKYKIYLPFAFWIW